MSGANPPRLRAAPIWLRALLALIVMLNIVNIVGALINFRIAPALPDVSVSPLAQLLVACAFLLIFARLLIGLQRRTPSIYTAVAPVLTLYALFGLAWNLLLTRATYSRETFGFDCLLTVLILFPVWWTAWRRGWLSPLRSAQHPGSMQRS
ncbi:MAG TPA: hypothetical protein VKQ72_06710 [Aggregatilineales bacterium]|nr:hypothetical protein [Aggregatilineales bacterium]